MKTPIQQPTSPASDAMPCSAVLPCPFCGFDDENYEPKDQVVSCPNCGAQGPSDLDAWGFIENERPADHQAAWNERRVPCSNDVTVCIHHHREEIKERDERMKNIAIAFRRMESERNATIKLAFELSGELADKCNDPIHKAQFEAIKELMAAWSISQNVRAHPRRDARLNSFWRLLAVGCRGWFDLDCC